MKKLFLGLLLLAWPAFADVSISGGTINANHVVCFSNTLGQITDCANAANPSFGAAAGLVVPSGVFASKPAAAAGLLYYATDLGNYGCLLESTASAWHPASGRCTIYQSGTATSTTNSASETNLAIIAVPAGIPTSKGSVQLTAVMIATGTTNTKTPSVRVSSTSGDTSTGTQVYNGSLASGNLAAAIIKTGTAKSSATNSQIWSNTGSPGTGNNSSSPTTSSIDTTAAWYVNLNGSTTNSGDTFGYSSEILEWIE